MEQHADGSSFLPSVTFTGAKPGFVFKTGSQGLGYYRDSGVAGLHSTGDAGRDDVRRGIRRGVQAAVNCWVGALLS